MSAPEQQMPDQGRFYRVVERGYRTRVYRPARYYLTWYFLASLFVTADFIVWAAFDYLNGGIVLLENHLPYQMAGFLCGLFLMILSTYYGMIASSLHIVLGDRGIYSLGSVPATAPIVTSSTFLCTTPAAQALYDESLHGARITRFKVWRWGRKGGCQNWPGRAGGKSEGFWAAVVYAWEQAEVKEKVPIMAKDEKGADVVKGYEDRMATKVLEKQPCPTCNRDNVTKRERADWLGFIRVPALTTQDLQRMAQDTPGFKRGGVIDIRSQVMADRYADELPYPLMDAIMHDEEFRASSRVDVCFDPLPEEGSLGMVLPHNAETELLGLQFTSKMMRKQSVDLHQTLAILGQLRGPLGGTGQQ